MALPGHCTSIPIPNWWWWDPANRGQVCRYRPGKVPRNIKHCVWEYITPVVAGRERFLCTFLLYIHVYCAHATTDRCLFFFFFLVFISLVSYTFCDSETDWHRFRNIFVYSTAIYIVYNVNITVKQLPLLFCCIIDFICCWRFIFIYYYYYCCCCLKSVQHIPIFIRFR